MSRIVPRPIEFRAAITGLHGKRDSCTKERLGELTGL